MATLISHDSMQKKESEKIFGDEAMIASNVGYVKGRTTNKPGGSSSWGRSQGYKRSCYYCDQKGHLIKDCPKLKADKVKLADAAVGESSNDVEDFMLTISSGEEKLDWIMDSGCSYHICANKNYFATYQGI